MTDATRAASPPAPRGTRLTLHAFSNLLLGASLGLLLYLGVTNITNAIDQSVIRSSLSPVWASALGPAAAGDLPAGTMDFDGWDTLDAPYWRAIREGGAFARIVIPRMGLDTMVVKGTAAADLRRGPGWIKSTDLPGPTGNVGISGHRTTYGHPFGRLNELAPGDTIELYSPYRRYLYEVVRSFAVTPDHVEVVAHTEEPQLTLTACHPPYSARLRLIVQAKLVDVRKLAEAPTGP